jgi:uncharacterized membrane protein SirB2
MSTKHKTHLAVKWGRCTVIPWYRQVLALIFGVGVMIIAVWAIDQGQGMWMIIAVAGMAFTTLLLIFGVEVDYIEIANSRIEFTNTSKPKDDE